MQITEIRVKLADGNAERLKGFCTLTIDHAFVIRDLKIIEGTNGLFVAMPSRKLADRCPNCGAKNHLRSKYCNECGTRLNENRAPRDAQGRTKLHADVAHPINAECRQAIQKAVIEAYYRELERSRQPDYQPPRLDEEFDDDVDFDDLESDYASLIDDLKKSTAARRQTRGHSESVPAIPGERREQSQAREGGGGEGGRRRKRRRGRRGSERSGEREHRYRSEGAPPAPAGRSGESQGGSEPVSRPEPATPPPAPTPQPAPAPPAPEESDFGAGIF